MGLHVPTKGDIPERYDGTYLTSNNGYFGAGFTITTSDPLQPDYLANHVVSNDWQKTTVITGLSRFETIYKSDHTAYDGLVTCVRRRLVATTPSKIARKQNFLKIISREPYYWVYPSVKEYVTVEAKELTIPAGRLVSEWIELIPPVVDGYEYIVSLIPMNIEDNQVATGVDNVSITADPADIGAQTRSWIMAPCGGTDYSNDMRFKIPIIFAAPLAMTCTNATAAPSTTTLSLAYPGPIVTWTGTGAETSDNTPIFKFGPAEQIIDLPVGVKTMKKRTVNVKCYMVRTPDSTNSITTCGKASLEETLNRIYGPQINAYFNVEIKQPAVVTVVDYDLNGNGWVDPEDAAGNTSTEGAKIINGTLRDANGDIHIYYTNYHVGISTTPPREPGEEVGSGILAATPKDGNNIFVSPRIWPYEELEVTRMLAHEIGHVLLGLGHPDQESGVAPLKGTDNTKRLMYSTSHSNADSKLLVKTEWDKAEEWLKLRPRGDQ